MVVLCVMLWGAVANFSLFNSHSSSLYAQDFQPGIASYYSLRDTGARTASGELLHHDSLTCAHRTYPFGTLLKVTNPANELSVIVRVTDRGPYWRGRIIDLSWGAAKALGIINQGIASVVVERIGSVTIPFKDDSEIEVPELLLEIHRMGDGSKPVWQEPRIDHRKVRRQMQDTADKSWIESLWNRLTQ